MTCSHSECLHTGAKEWMVVVRCAWVAAVMAEVVEAAVEGEGRAVAVVAEAGSC